MNMRIMLLTVFGLGRMPFAPGTFGSLPPVVLALFLVWLVMPQAEYRWMVEASLMLLGVIFAVACVRFGREAEETFGGKDPQQVVADEVAGQAMPLLFLPWRDPVDWDGWRWNMALALTAFIAFRVFDIAKPPPARRVQKIGGGWGVLLDDLVAGLYAILATQLIAHLVLPMIVP